MPPSKPGGYYSSRIPPNLPLRKWLFTFLLATLALSRSTHVHAGFTSSLASGFYRPVHYNINHHLNQLRPQQSLKSKDKVEFLGAVLKRHIADLRQTKNKQVELVFLVDNSGSVGSHNFFNEIKFVRKLLADFTVDENTTRVAIVTFSSRPKIIKHVDFLTSPSPDNHKCSLLEEYIPKIRYSGGGTFTLGAFKMADTILRHARRDARKAVILITDGFSNAGDPRPLAALMRNNGVKIFTFGIRHGNVRELMDMASHPKNETCYILDSFEEFEALARRALHEDLQGGSYSRQLSKRCDKLCLDGRDCCDEKAFCTCGTHTGNYECLCQKGYYGNGLLDGCLPCPSGTYKNISRPGDIMSCTRCPDENHMTEEGSISADQCHCKKGFRKFGENRCASLVCEKLNAPTSGYFVNEKCSNNFNAACGTRCQPGYELQGDSVRICQEDGQWSGNTTECVMKTCPFLPTPKNGNRICSRGDFTYSTVCRFTCDNGYKLIGSRKRTCLAIAYWSGMTTKCREITCQHLNELASGTVSPEVCTGGGEVPFGTTCKMTCNDGYSLDGPHTKQCTPDGIWSPVDKGEVSRCIDTRPPLVVCPSNIEVEAEKDVNTANVTWIPPLAIDNSGLVPTLTARPAVEPPTRFPIGVSEVTYVAEDASKNKQECKFSIVVKDTQAPRVDRCPRQSTIVSEKLLTNVTWMEPLFSDNSNQPLRITKTHEPNSLFPQGVTNVTYTAFDQSDNASNCTIKINIIEHKCIVPPAPSNGLRDCYKDAKGMHCSLSCMEGYAFAIPPPNEYYCAFKDHKWAPADKLPFPDCSAQQMSNDVIQPAKLTFMGKVSCNEKTTLNRISDNFQNRVTQLVDNMCGNNMNCNVDDLRTTCEDESDYNRIRVLLGRSKREAEQSNSRKRRHLKSIGDQFDKEKHSVITFDFKLEVIFDLEDNSGDVFQGRILKHGVFQMWDKGSRLLRMKNYEADTRACWLDVGFWYLYRPTRKFPQRVGLQHAMLSDLVPEIIIGTSQSSGNLSKDIEHQEEILDSMKDILEQLKSEAGKMEFDKDLLFTNISYEAEQPTFLCKTGNVQIDNRCVRCPVGTFFNVVHRRCLSCSKGTYQHQEGMVTCMVCPAHTSTLSKHSKTINECKAQCLPGSFSHDGLEFCETCPIGFYQPAYTQKECLKCPDGTSTITRGSRLISNCKEFCKPGYVSETGMELCIACPLGTYQSEKGKTSCFLCPNKAPTNTTGATQLQECKDWDLQGDFSFGQTKGRVSFHICFLKPCRNGGTCEREGSKFKCKCTTGFTGSKCELIVDSCKAKPCLNGGYCSTIKGSYRCTCKKGFSGKKCEIDLNGCFSNPCQNGARCVDTPEAFRCICPNGFEGAACEKNVDECASKPCMNGGTCVDFIGRYSCTCKDGYKGVNCEINIDECAMTPCQNNGTCQDQDDGYTCSCVPGFVGKKCEQEVKECLKSPCLNAGTCEDKINGYNCRCQLQYTGKDCETELDSNFIIQFDAASTTNYAALTIEKPLTAFSLSFWMKSNDLFNYGTIVSYATPNNTNAIIFMDYSGFILYINGKNINTDIEANDGIWHHIVVTWTNENGAWNVYLDALPIVDGTGLNNNGVIPGGGSFVIGQEQDEVGGNFNQRESFIGQLGQLNLWDRIISLHEIEHMLTNCDKIGNVIAWPSVQGSIHGQVKKIPSVFCQDCNVLKYPNYGKVRITDISTGSNAIYSCNKGYILAGRSVRMCLASAEWSDIDPECDRVSCNRPRQLKNGYVLGRIFTYDSRVRYSCNRGYRLVGANTSYCMENGEWSNGDPICKEITCSQPILSNNTILVNKRSTYLPKFIAQFKCESGYKMITNHSKLVCQSDGSWDKSVPTCDGTLCGTPPEIKDGRLKEKTQTNYFVGDAIEYRCNFGFTLQNGTNPKDGTLLCQPDGLWEKSIPTCGIINCGYPPGILSGTVHFKGTDYLGRAEYTCSHGYQISSEELLECLEEGLWVPKPPTCNPVICNQPARVENAESIASNNTYGSILTYKCKTGFLLVGENKRECSANGNWTGKSPTCEPIRCPKPDNINNGYPLDIGSDYTYGSVVRFKCNPGYSISNTSDMLCGSNGTWQNHPPTCRPAKCTPPPTVKYGRFNATLETFVFSNTVDYSCELGYILNGTEKLTCNETLLWSPEAPICNPVKCPEPDKTPNGIVQTDGLEFGRKAEYECLLNHEMIGEDTRICRANKTWSGEPPTCVPLTCTEPSLIDNGFLMFGNLSVGAVLKYKCSSGYYLLGDIDRICLSDLTWSGHTGTCLPVLCPEPADISNGYRNYTKKTYKSEVTYNCNHGYGLVGKNNRICTENKTWSGSVPKCEVADKACPELKVKNGYASIKKSGPRPKAHISCNYRYTVVGPDERDCLANGSWSGGNEPLCAKNCLYAPFINHGTIEGLRTYNKNVTYTCYDGYKLEGNPTRTCLLNGTWSGNTPKCIKKTCPSPVNISNGTSRHLKYLSEPLLIYKCNPGFKLEGKNTMICRSNGSWTPPTPPKCVEQLCPEIQVPANGTLSSTTRSVGTNVHVICDEGFRLRWNTSVYCKPNLIWGGVKPVCTQYACVQPNDIQNGYVLLPKAQEVTPFAKKIFQKTLKLGNSRLSKLGGTITYTCNPGYTLVGDASRRCISPYRWSGNEPECVTAKCPEISIVNGLVDKNHERHPGATVIFKCLRNFQPIGKPILRCSTKGEWIGDNVCEANVCPEIKTTNNIHLSTQNRNVGSQVRILCNPGFKTSGQAKTVAIFCLPNLKWTKATVHCTPVSCGEPTPILNGKNEFGSNFMFNSTVSYECNEGYDLIGDENRTCQADRTWSGRTPTCERTTCGPPPFVVNGRYSVFDYQAEYFCDEGYSLMGDVILVCGLDGKWNFSESPLCKPNQCEYNDIMKNGNWKVLAGEVGRVNSKIKVSCNIGYRLRGAPILLCLHSGDWDRDWPECEPIYCPEPPPIENGDVKLPETFQYGQNITLVCNENYVISGNAVPMCQANGTWSNGWPECLLNICPTPASPENGKVSPSNRKVGSFISYYCKDGYTINGPSKRFCLSNKTWSEIDPFCEKLKCEEFSVLHGQIFIEQSPSKNDRAQYKCDVGFKIKPGVPPWLTCVNGKWVGLQSSCVPQKCPRPPTLSNAVPVRGDLSYGEKLIYTCLSGYEFVDVNFLVCGPMGKYAGKMPECRKASCGPPPGIQYATMTMSASEEKALILCNRGYILEGPTMLYCLENKTWPATEAKCVPLDCGSPPKLEKASVSLPNGTTYGAFAEYTCFKGLVLVGREMSMCQMDGTWQPIDDSSCILRDCGKPITNDHVKYFGSSYTLESLVFYSCENGYILEGATLAFCLKDGHWSNRSPTCNPVSCGDPPEPPYEGFIVHSEGHHYKNIVEYDCYGRMMPDGPTTIQCTADSTWNGTAPDCYELPKVICGRPLVRKPETIKLIGSSYTEGDTIFYLCRHGLSPKRRPSILVCQSDGYWDDEAECNVFCKFTCRNGGMCIGYNRCKCQPGYAGSRCEKPVCILPCLNGGYCGSPFKCTCKAGYTGSRCHNAHCRRKCENGGRCIQAGKCLCPVGFRPPYCSKRMSESDSFSSKKQWTSQSQKQKAYYPVNLLSKVESVTTPSTTTTTTSPIITTSTTPSPHHLCIPLQTKIHF